MHADFVIIGAGILGLTIARELRINNPSANILILEKENTIGLHASGRNSGILHAGIYYKSDSLKAKFCLEGLRAMAAYCDDNQLPIERIGKIILPTNQFEEEVAKDLFKRAEANGAFVRMLNTSELQEMEPLANLNTKLALFSPQTAVVAPKEILTHIYSWLLTKKVDFRFNSNCVDFAPKQRKIRVNNTEISYGHLFNTAGLYADKVARACGLTEDYTMIPFKGIYYELKKSSKIAIKHLIYPVPDMNVPFLGVHFTKSIDGKVYVGPSAVPVLGREHYSGITGIRMLESLEVFSQLGLQYLTNKQGFRNYAHQEVPRFIKSKFVEAARAMLPSITPEDLVKSKKVGIRAQLFDKKKKELAMDFIIRKTNHETHVLNAVSPAFTSSFSFAKYVVSSFENVSLTV